MRNLVECKPFNARITKETCARMLSAAKEGRKDTEKFFSSLTFGAYRTNKYISYRRCLKCQNLIG